jgi:hypothetical protein
MGVTLIPETIDAFSIRFGARRVAEIAAELRIQPPSADSLLSRIDQERLFNALERGEFEDNALLSDLRRRTPTPIESWPRGRRATQPESLRTEVRRTPHPSDVAADWPRAVHRWIENFRGRGFQLPPQVVVCGRRPYDHAVIKELLERHHSSVAFAGDPDSPCMVLGREDWFIDDIEQQIKARSGQQLFIYSQEMLELALWVGADPFQTADAATLKEFADGHPALQCCIEEGFLWPSIPTAKISKRLDAMIEQVAESPLHKEGYRVGKIDGLPERDRQSILERTFHGQLKFVESIEYMQQWGQPGSRRRLRRIARLIAWQVGGARGRAEKLGHDMSAATRDWRDDLEWMQRDLYEPWMCFRWPDINVPDVQGRPVRKTRRRKGT